MNPRGMLDLIRPVNCVMLGFAVIVGAFVSKPPTIPTLQLALGFFTGFFMCAYSMAVNDIYDLEVDRVNRPDRPIPSGRITISQASKLALVMLAVGSACSFLSLNPLAVFTIIGKKEIKKAMTTLERIP
jgi:geranylgeranylglycerol-phosphate geranylgeranyltransferase